MEQKVVSFHQLLLNEFYFGRSRLLLMFFLYRSMDHKNQLNLTIEKNKMLKKKNKI